MTIQAALAARNALARNIERQLCHLEGFDECLSLLNGDDGVTQQTPREHDPADRPPAAIARTAIADHSIPAQAGGSVSSGDTEAPPAAISENRPSGNTGVALAYPAHQGPLEPLECGDLTDASKGAEPAQIIRESSDQEQIAVRSPDGGSASPGPEPTTASAESDRSPGQTAHPIDPPTGTAEAIGDGTTDPCLDEPATQPTPSEAVVSEAPAAELVTGTSAGHSYPEDPSGTAREAPSTLGGSSATSDDVPAGASLPGTIGPQVEGPQQQRLAPEEFASGASAPSSAAAADPEFTPARRAVYAKIAEIAEAGGETPTLKQLTEATGAHPNANSGQSALQWLIKHGFIANVGERGAPAYLVKATGKQTKAFVGSYKPAAAVPPPLKRGPLPSTIAPPLKQGALPPAGASPGAKHEIVNESSKVKSVGFAVRTPATLDAVISYLRQSDRASVIRGGSGFYVGNDGPMSPEDLIEIANKRRQVAGLSLWRLAT